MRMLNIGCVIYGAKKGSKTGARLGKKFGTKGAVIE